jgi:hypothetical protein
MDYLLFYGMVSVAVAVFAGSLWLLNAGVPKPIEVCKTMEVRVLGKPVHKAVCKKMC